MNAGAPTYSPYRVLVTGGCGFIGSNFVRHLLESDPGVSVVNIDALTYCGNPENLRDVEARFPDRYRFLHGDIRDRSAVHDAMEGCDTVVHFAAESHVDRSITGGHDFITTNVEGTYLLLEEARAAKLSRFLHISTDEVYGSTLEGSFGEKDNLDPSSPYSASKAAADLRIVLTGYLFGEAYQELGSNAGIFVETSGVGGTHPALVEAMAFDRCVVVHDTPENLESIAAAGRSYKGAGGAQALAPVLQELLDRPDLRAELGDASGRRARQHYTWQAVTDAYERLFHQLCER